MIQSTIAQCFTRKTPSTPVRAESDSRLDATREALRHASASRPTNMQQTTPGVSWMQIDSHTGNDRSISEPNQQDLHTYFDSIVSESNHLSLFKKMTEKSPSLIDMTLIYAPSTSKNVNDDNNEDATHQEIRSRNAKLSKLKMEWEQACLKWGFVVVRQLTYVQNTLSDILPPKTDQETPIEAGIVTETQEEPISNISGMSIVVNGQIALKEKDEIVVTHVFPNSPAYEAGIVQGDVVHAVYGMKDPTLGLLFGIMRDSSRFVLTVKRMESSFDRSLRGKSGIIPGTKQSATSASSSHQEEGYRECNEESCGGEVGHSGNIQLNRSVQECPPFDSVSETSYDDDSDYRDLFGETMADVTDTTAVFDATHNLTEKTSSFPAPDRVEPQDNQLCATTSLEKRSKDNLNPSKQHVLQKPIATYYRDMSSSDKENYSNTVDGNRNSFLTSAKESNTMMTSNDMLEQFEEAVTNLPQSRHTEGKASSVNDQLHSDGPLIHAKNDPGRSDRLNSTLASNCSSKVSCTRKTYVATKVEQSTNNLNTVHNITRNEGAQGQDTVAEARMHSDSDLLDSTGSEGNSLSDEVLLSCLIEKSIENKSTKSSIVDQNSQKVAKKRKLSDVVSISSRATCADGIKRNKDQLQTENSCTAEQSSEADTNGHKKASKSGVALSDERLGSKRNGRKKLSDDSPRDERGKTKKNTVGDAEVPSILQGSVSLKKVAGEDSFRNDSFDDISNNKNLESETKHGAIGSSSHREMARYSKESSKGRNNSISSLDFSTTGDDSDFKMIRASPLTLPRPSPLTVSRQPSKVTVTSTSSKAGLGPVKSAKLKRLWPDSSVFSKRILKWGPPELVIEDLNIRFKGNVRSNTKNKLPLIPSSFRDASEMIKYMSPHILDEGLHSIQQEFLANSDRNGIWTRDVFSMKLRVSLFYSVILLYMCIRISCLILYFSSKS